MMKKIRAPKGANKAVWKRWMGWLNGPMPSEPGGCPKAAYPTGIAFPMNRELAEGEAPPPTSASPDIWAESVGSRPDDVPATDPFDDSSVEGTDMAHSERHRECSTCVFRAGGRKVGFRCQLGHTWTRQVRDAVRVDQGGSITLLGREEAKAAILSALEEGGSRGEAARHMLVCLAGRDEFVDSFLEGIDGLIWPDAEEMAHAINLCLSFEEMEAKAMASNPDPSREDGGEKAYSLLSAVRETAHRMGFYPVQLPTLEWERWVDGIAQPEEGEEEEITNSDLRVTLVPTGNPGRDDLFGSVTFPRWENPALDSRSRCVHHTNAGKRFQFWASGKKRWGTWWDYFFSRSGCPTDGKKNLQCRGIREEAFHAWVEMSRREWQTKVHVLSVWAKGATKSGKCDARIAILLDALEDAQDFSEQEKICKVLRQYGDQNEIKSLSELGRDKRGEFLLRGKENGSLFFWRNPPEPQWAWAEDVGRSSHIPDESVRHTSTTPFGEWRKAWEAAKARWERQQDLPARANQQG